MTVASIASARRWLLTLLMGIAILLLAGVGTALVLNVRSELYAQVHSQLESLVAERVSSWEDELVDKLSQWAENVGVDPRHGALAQRAMRSREPWLDAVYTWTPREEVVADGRRQERPARFLFPQAGAREPTRWLTEMPCVVQAFRAVQESNASQTELAEALVYSCQEAGEGARLVAATEAVTRLANARQFLRAREVLDGAGIPDNIDLATAIQRGLDATRVVVLRLQKAGLDLEDGELDTAMDAYYQLGLDIVQLDAPDAEALLHLVDYPIVARLQQNGRKDEARRLERARDRAERRVQAWREVAERLLPRPPTSEANAAPRFVYDQYSQAAQAPFLLHYSWVKDGGLGVALQLDQPLLLRDLLDAIGRYDSDVVVTDATGAYVAGSRSGGPVAVDVPFTRTLTHLRVGLRETAVERRVAKLNGQWLVPLTVMAISALCGLGALAAFTHAASQQRELLERQRDFATRVTHELKTPLAGIKLMAENLEMGVYKTEDQRIDMAKRIQNEADRLRDRVDEVLAVARTRSIPNPEPLDPEEPLLEAVDMWGPRFETANIRFEADLDATDTVMGDKTALRDAVSCLLDNAIKYAKPEGQDRFVQLTLRQEGRWIEIVVRDNGLGVPAAMRKGIFGRFVRVEGPNRGFSGGHGLGLAQVADIVRAHRGTVECKEGLDGGAAFVLRVPAIRS